MVGVPDVQQFFQGVKCLSMTGLGPRQHDAHEFFCTLVGAVADEKPKNGNNNKEAKDDSGEEGQNGQTPSGEAAAQNFQGQICSTFLCWKCSLDL